MFLYSCTGGGTEKNSEESSVPSEPASTEEVVERSVNLEGSTVSWAGTMLGMYTHTGTVGIKKANISTQGNKVVDGTFEVDMKDIETTDDNYNVADEKTPEKLIGHLSSDDFFSVESHPTATFEITAVEGNEVTGNLTIRGNTNVETIKDVVVTEMNDKMEIAGTLTFDRQKYDVAFKHPAQEMVISDDIELDIKLITE